MKPRPRPHLVILLSLLVMVLAAVVFVAASIAVVFQGRVTTEELCGVSAADRGALRVLLILARHRSLARPDLGEHERRRIIDFYDEALAVVPAIECGTGGDPEPKTKEAP